MAVTIDEEVWSSIAEGQLNDITLEDFTVCMKRQLKMYMEAMVADEMLLATLTDQQSRPVLSALKLLMLNTCIDTEAPSLAETVDAINKRLGRLEKVLNVDVSVPLQSSVPRSSVSHVSFDVSKAANGDVTTEAAEKGCEKRSSRRHQRATSRKEGGDEGEVEVGDKDCEVVAESPDAGQTPPVAPRVSSRRGRREGKKVPVVSDD